MTEPETIFFNPIGPSVSLFQKLLVDEVPAISLFENPPVVKFLVCSWSALPRSSPFDLCGGAGSFHLPPRWMCVRGGWTPSGGAPGVVMALALGRPASLQRLPFMWSCLWKQPSIPRLSYDPRRPCTWRLSPRRLLMEFLFIFFNDFFFNLLSTVVLFVVGLALLLFPISQGSCNLYSRLTPRGRLTVFLFNFPHVFFIF